MIYDAFGNSNNALLHHCSGRWNSWLCATGFLRKDSRRGSLVVCTTCQLLGVPMYSNAAGIVPIISALLEKGAALGTTLAFMMAVIALSLPEAILLRKVLKPKLLAIFF